MNNDLPQGVITNDNVNASQQQPSTDGKKKFTFKKPNLSKKQIIIIALVFFVAFILYCFFASGKGAKVFGNNNSKQDDKIINVDVDTEWGKEYATEIQSIYKEKEINSFDIAFINLNDMDEPELIVKYVDSYDKEFIKVFYIDPKNGRVRVTKEFSNADIKMLYSLIDGTSDFYLNIITSKKYGTYTLFSKILAGTVVGADINATNEKQLNEFADKYIVADYEIVYYQVKKDKFAENYKTMYERHEKYENEIIELKQKLKEQYQNMTKKDVDEKPYLVTGNFHLTYGEYEHVPVKDINNQDITSSYAGTTIILNNDKTINIKGIVHKFIVNGNVLTIDNGSTIKVNSDDNFVLNEEGGTLFKAKNPYVDPNAPLENGSKSSGEGESNNQNGGNEQPKDDNSNQSNGSQEEKKNE